MITIYTDGACSGNPGKGGFGIVMISGKHRKEISQGYRYTTNNRMELLSVIVALEALKIENSEVRIYSDSKYVVDAIEKGWLNDWIRKRFKKIKNQDLWLRYLDIEASHRVKLIWIKGHANNKENERCDQLAVEAASGKDLLIDIEYEKNESSQTNIDEVNI